jgi:hypothetical protein
MIIRDFIIVGLSCLCLAGMQIIFTMLIFKKKWNDKYLDSGQVAMERSHGERCCTITRL